MPATPDPIEPGQQPDDALYQDDDTLEPRTVADCVREAPLAALMTAFVAGLFVGRLVL